VSSSKGRVPRQVPQRKSTSTVNSIAHTQDRTPPAGGSNGNDLGLPREKDPPGRTGAGRTSPARPRSRWKPIVIILSNLFAAFALMISYWSMREQQKSTEVGRALAYSNATQQIIHDQYELCRELDQMRVEHPEVSHVLMLPSAIPNDPWVNYRKFKGNVRELLSDGKETISAADRSKLLLQEHAVALNVFDIYEQTIYQWEAAAAAKDTQRAEILKMLVDYYEKRMLRNPRLRYHWRNGGSDMMEEVPTRQRYNQHVEIDSNEVDSRYPHDFVDDLSPLDSPLPSAP
jgi:hypothetical protein